MKIDRKCPKCGATMVETAKEPFYPGDPPADKCRCERCERVVFYKTGTDKIV